MLVDLYNGCKTVVVVVVIHFTVFCCCYSFYCFYCCIVCCIVVTCGLYVANKCKIQHVNHFIGEGIKLFAVSLCSVFLSILSQLNIFM